MNFRSRPTFLYRMYGRNELLLYVGISCSFFDRMEDHYVRKDWFDDVHVIVAERFVDREAAENAEIAAIKTERPLHNVVHNQWCDGQDTLDAEHDTYGRAFELRQAHREARCSSISDVFEHWLLDQGGYA